LLGAQDGRAAFGVGHLFKRCEPTLVKTMDPIVGDGEMAADPVGGIRQRVAPVNLIDNSIALVHAGGKR
jgi:hypothetical protein